MSHPDHDEDLPEDGSGGGGSGNGPGSSPGAGGSPEDPLAALLRQLGLDVTPGQPIDLAALMGQLGAMTGSPGTGIGFQPPGSGGARQDPDAEWNWLKDQVRKMTAALGPDPSPTSAQKAQVADTARLAEMWLDEACEFGPVRNPAAVWSRAEWIEATFSSWRPLAEPVVDALAEALGKAPGAATAGEDDPFAMITTMLAPMMRDAARRMYAGQFAQALAKLSTSVVSASDLGFQLSEPRIAVLSSNIETHFGELDVPREDVVLYVSLREAARQRLFQHVTWLGPQLQALVEHYARETRIDLSAIEQALDISELGQFDPARLAEISQAVQGKLFDPDPTPEQAEVLERLQTLLALVEGWVDHVVHSVASRWMPAEPALFEAFRRRRGIGGPTEEVFRALVGLDLRPRRIRDAANLWAAVENVRGQAGRDAIWAHPDLLPTAAGLDDPMGFASPQEQVGEEQDEWDRGLQQLLREEGQQD